MKWLLLVLAACEASEDITRKPVPPVEPACREDPRRPTRCDVRIDELPATEDRPIGRYDATISTALRARFGREHARSCGVLERHAPTPDITAAHDCVRDALATSHPFALVQSVQGDDSAFAHALVGLVENGRFTMYTFTYDSDPCGGSCAAAGGTLLEHCTSPTAAACDYRTLSNCATCAETVEVDSWYAGEKTTLATAEAERILPRTIGATPASLGPLFAGASLGALAEPTRAALANAVVEARAGGVVSIRTQEDARQLRAVLIGVAGPCGAFRDRIVAAWGKSTDDAWLDPAAHRRAYLVRRGCTLHVESYAEIAEWLASVPVDAVGLRATALRDRLAPKYAVRVADGVLAWRDVGVGRRGGEVELAAWHDHGRVLEIVVSGHTDSPTFEQLRARLVAQRGAPSQDDRINAGATRYVAWPGLSLSGGTDGSFELRANRL